MTKWGRYRLAMWVIVLLMTWTAWAIWMDNDIDFQLVFFSLFGMFSFVMLAMLTIADILDISWGSKPR